MTNFADQLFDDLMREHGPTLAHTRLAHTGLAGPRRHVAARRMLLAAGAGGVAVGATVGALVATSGTPAFAVTKNANGTVTLAVYQKSGIAGANAKLRQLGDGQVVVVPVEPGCPSAGSLPAPAVSAKGELVTVQSEKGANGSVTVSAQGIPVGDILVVGFVTTGQGTMGGGTITSPPAPSCISLPSPPPGNGGSGSGSGATTGSGAGQSLNAGHGGSSDPELSSNG
jgi:hypothetical protein